MNSFLRFSQLWQLTNALFKEIIREPGVLFWGILFPILMSLGLGLAFTKKADVTRNVAVVTKNETRGDTITTFSLESFLANTCEKNSEQKEDSYNWRLKLKNDKLGNYIFYFYEMDWDKAMLNLKRGVVNIIILENNGKPEYHFDPKNSDAQLTYIILNSIIGRRGGFLFESDENIRPLIMRGTRYIDFLVPGLITMGVMMSCMWGISYGLIEKRSKKLLRRFVATPMKKSNFLFAQITVRFLMNFFESLVLLIFSMIAFKMKIQGDISSLVLIFFAGNFAFSGLAVFVSSHTSNTEVGNGLINAVVFPMMILSGIFFSYQNFPAWSIDFIRVLPLTMFTDGVRSIFNEGAGLGEIWFPAFLLFSTGTLFFAAGLKIFKWH